MNYGVLKATPVDFGREDTPDSPHFQLIATVGTVRWRIPVNVRSTAAGAASQALVLFHLEDPLTNAALLDKLTALDPGFHAKQPGLAMDFIRESMFALSDMKVVEFSGPGENDDVQDILTVHVKRAIAGGSAIYAFGEPFDATVSPRPADKQFHTTMGVHNIHMNQGNPTGGGHAGDNGTFQDGGLLIQLEDRWLGFFVAFQSQLIPTSDQTGNPLPGAKPILQATGGGGTGGGTGGGVTGQSPLQIIAALANPIGADPGLETVTLINVSAGPVAIDGWKLIDKGGKADALSGSIAAGDAMRVRLTGNGAQLGNDGGSIRLTNPSGATMDSVTYDKAAASVQGVTLVFG
ncbi:MAG: DUF2278 family protein [Bryobacteraceae bacterium]